MREEHEQQAQAEKLRQRFKQTGIVPPVTEWVPRPTAGDLARQVSQDIIGERDAQLPLEQERAKQLWELTDRRKPV